MANYESGTRTRGPLAWLNAASCVINMHASSNMTGAYRPQCDSFHDMAYLIGRAETQRDEGALNSSDSPVRKTARSPPARAQRRKESEMEMHERKWSEALMMMIWPNSPPHKTDLEARWLLLRRTLHWSMAFPSCKCWRSSWEWRFGEHQRMFCHFICQLARLCKCDSAVLPLLTVLIFLESVCIYHSKLNPPAIDPEAWPRWSRTNQCAEEQCRGSEEMVRIELKCLPLFLYLCLCTFLMQNINFGLFLRPDCKEKPLQPLTKWWTHPLLYL